MYEWAADAACRTLPKTTFYPDDPEGVAVAKAICETCPVRTQCLETALSNREEDGVWGGLTFPERKHLARQKAAKHRRSR